LFYLPKMKTTRYQDARTPARWMHLMRLAEMQLRAKRYRRMKPRPSRFARLREMHNEEARRHRTRYIWF
jgi:hypothetical protein